MARHLVAFMDRSLIVLNKPVGLIAQGGRHAFEPKTMTLDYVLQDLHKSLGLATKPLPVHRLDKPTTGALVLARNPQTAQTLSAQLRRPSSNDLVKTYLALVRGSFEPQSTGQVHKSLCIIDGRVSILEAPEQAESKGLSSYTTWRCLESKDGVSLMELGLRTGIKHQLRITMARVLNAPIIGDQIYALEDGHLMLHSARVEILRYLRKPVSNSRTYRLGITVPPPFDFLAMCQNLGLSVGHEWTHSPVRVTINGSDLPYDGSSPLDEEVVVDSDSLFPSARKLMKGDTQSISSRILSVTRSTGSLITQNIPLPGLSEVKYAAKKLVDGLETIDDHTTKCQNLTSRITSILGMLEPHCQDGEVSLELGYFYNKLEICQRQLARIDSRRGLTNALRARRQVEIVERMEHEIGTGLQDVLLSIMLKRLSAPREVTVFKPVDKAPQPASSRSYRYPRIKRCQISLGTMIRRHRLDDVIRSVTRGTYRDRDVLVVQYSSKGAPGKAAKVFLSSVNAVIQEQHPNVLRFIGASEDASSFDNHYMLFDVGAIATREVFVQSLRDAQRAFNFLKGVKAGMGFLIEYGVQTWTDIHVSQDGHAIVCPPYWDDPDTWSKSNHDVFTSLTGTTHYPDFPLTSLTEILNMSDTRWPEFEQAVMSHGYGLRDYHLMQIAHELDLPVPPFLLVYSGPLPDFLVSVGSIGVPEWVATGQPSDCFSGSMTAWTGISSLWTCTGWEALQSFILDYWTVGRTPCSNDEYETFPHSEALEPLDSSSDGWLSYGCFESSESFGVAYELAISDPALFQASWKRFEDTRLPTLTDMDESEQPAHAVRHISVSIHYNPPKMRDFLPLYFHRRPSSMFNVEHYWGFLSDSPDPDVPPCKLVRDIQVEYSIKINTLRANDSWTYRAEQCFENVISKTPGSFNIG